ncbi:D-alanyl-D-alanine carboxypeptidase family protein [Microbacterium sp. H1-D42]|uniref:D-alanyl-D-alanine carboxypeptidase family protein n=1 Tax=Microbacterium sp. H1-D42 TaxID=2925844 RepID=UPI001F530799|nr:D-alanyl-D-alanine carboxypeptidase family protein [Microbacterium sp. H1-D42]UNK70632.1 D-alanyl-D-alanine carboxypeptidase family protein [Microbacterium sp. H1-D42]
MNSVRTMTAATERRRRRRRRTLTGITVLIVVLAAFAVTQAALQLQHAPRAAADGQPVVGQPAGTTADREVTGADGVIRDGEQVNAWSDVPAVTNLEPALLDALRRAADDAAADGVEIRLNSGWRTPAYQNLLLQDATAEHGTAEEAARWVATPEESEHVSGEAVDIGPWRAAEWLADHGAAHGLCQVYANEAWHFELRPDAVDVGCPRMYADASERR